MREGLIAPSKLSCHRTPFYFHPGLHIRMHLFRIALNSINYLSGLNNIQF